MGLLLVAVATAAAGQSRNFDARASGGAQAPIAVAAEQLAASERLAADVPELAVDFDGATGVARSVRSHTGYLSPASPGRDARDLAFDFITANRDLLGLTAGDLADTEETDRVESAATGATHLYLRQTLRGIPVYNGQLRVSVNRDGRIISLSNAFLPDLENSVNTATPALSAEEARDDIEPTAASLMWLPVRAGSARLVWNFQFGQPDGSSYYDFTVDAVDGSVWTRFDWVDSAEYTVYAQPTESPTETTPLPPADARSVEVDPDDATASPFGWHDTDGAAGAEFTIPRGNNVHAYDDRNGNNNPPVSQPDCGTSLECNFPIDLTSDPSAYTPAAVTNLFYWNNLVHDVQYHYGFDEAGGNFQTNNYGGGGAGNDAVRAEAQDGSDNCNANMLTLPDGSPPRMQMFECTTANPDRDGDFDNAVIVHEYGHGISNRTVGGPANVSCLNNAQQPGEGLSDWWSLAYTAQVGDAGTDARGVGAYLIGEGPGGPGIRTFPYSTDTGVNPDTYSSISGRAIPHGVGEVWAEIAWEAYWELVDIHGFDPDLYNASGGAGNQRMMLYVQEGLKNSACSPTFIDVRDGIIQAAVDNHGGEDVCSLWEAFGRRGLGVDASTSGPSDTSPSNGFALPLECTCQPAPIADAGPDQQICLGDSTSVGTPAQPSNSYSWAPGGETTATINVSPLVTTDYTVTATTTCGSADDTATVAVDDGVTPPGLSDDFESGLGGWTATGLWHLAANSNCASPEPGFSSPVTAAYYGNDVNCTYNTGGANSGTLTSPPILGVDASSELSFDYLRAVESFAGSFDQTTVEILTDGGASATTVFFLDSSTASTGSWTSSGPISLAAFAGQVIQVRFDFDTVDGASNNFPGWFIDDVDVTGSSSCTPGGGLTLGAPVPGIAGQVNDFDVTGASSDARVILYAGRDPGSTDPGLAPCPGITVDLAGARRVSTGRTDANGDVTLSRSLPAGLSGRTMLFQVLDVETCTLSGVVSHAFP
jgi:extracellular elastinolytic metalloproteinase